MALQPYWEMAFATACTMAAAWLPPPAKACAMASAAALAEAPPSAHLATRQQSPLHHKQNLSPCMHLLELQVPINTLAHTTGPICRIMYS